MVSQVFYSNNWIFSLVPTSLAAARPFFSRAVRPWLRSWRLAWRHLEVPCPCPRRSDAPPCAPQLLQGDGCVALRRLGPRWPGRRSRRRRPRRGRCRLLQPLLLLAGHRPVRPFDGSVRYPGGTPTRCSTELPAPGSSSGTTHCCMGTHARRTAAPVDHMVVRMLEEGVALDTYTFTSLLKAVWPRGRAGMWRSTGSVPTKLQVSMPAKLQVSKAEQVLRYC